MGAFSVYSSSFLFLTFLVPFFLFFHFDPLFGIICFSSKRASFFVLFSCSYSFGENGVQSNDGGLLSGVSFLAGEKGRERMVLYMHGC